MIVKLLTEYHLEFLSLTGGCRGSSESTHVKMSHCWKSHAAAQYSFTYLVCDPNTTFAPSIAFKIFIISKFVFSGNSCPVKLI